ncbi:MAG: glycosyltransferase family 4 protein [Pleurocapsa sp. MO_226.B13]|nr:glycosyltransferase family 4 protein [Pleurocapsa sp. MO_226.B13]
MKILHLSTFDIIGGAARAAYRVHQGLRETGVDSWMLVRKRASDDRSVVSPRTVVGQVAGRIRAELNDLALRPYPTSNRSVFDPQQVPDRLLPQITRLNPDVINLHWVLNGYLQVETLARINKPVVWTLMDMWPFTGGCHYTQECERYTQTCGACPQLNSQKNKDLSRRVWQRKHQAWQNLNLTIVAPTHWLADCAKSSALFKDLRIEVIPFCLDTNVYKPIDKQAARAALNLPLDKKLILFGAISATQNRRKGFQLLQPALEKLAQAQLNEQADVVIFGSSRPEKPLDLGFQAHYLGHLNDHVSLVLAYSAADVFVAPSLQEAFGQTASEALACGTPVVAFKGTGLADIVDHQQNGYLAVPFEVDDLARGIAWILEDSDRHLKLLDKARQKAERMFRLELQANRYLDLYKELLKPTLKN